MSAPTRSRPEPARSPGVTYAELLDADTHEVNPCLRLQGEVDVGPLSFSARRYTSPEFFELEVDRIWKKTWQMACREEHLAEVGDTYVYDVVGLSALLVRCEPGEQGQIKAYVNACPHRGRQLRASGGWAGDLLRCPFHGLSWHHDGSLASLSAAWDFPHVEPERFCLTELAVATWEGWIFVNFDPDPVDFATYVGSLPEHFERWAPHRKYVSAHVGKIYPVNWKVAQEAFMEAFHVVGTHPQIAVATADMNSHYDCFGNFSRAITANGSPSPHLRWTPTEQEIFDSLTDRRLDQDIIAAVPDATTARAFTAALARKRHAKAVPGVETWCDAEMVDSMYFTLFPNFHPWGAFNRINYRFRPVERRVDRCLMECIYTDDFVGERPPPAPMRLLGLDERWSDAIDELGLLAKVFEQDSFNLPAVQAGLEAMGDRPVTLTRYQELKIRHFHHLLEAHLGHAVDPYR